MSISSRTISSREVQSVQLGASLVSAQGRCLADRLLVSLQDAAARIARTPQSTASSSMYAAPVARLCANPALEPRQRAGPHCPRLTTSPLGQPQPPRMGLLALTCCRSCAPCRGHTECLLLSGYRAVRNRPPQCSFASFSRLRSGQLLPLSGMSALSWRTSFFSMRRSCYSGRRQGKQMTRGSQWCAALGM